MAYGLMNRGWPSRTYWLDSDTLHGSFVAVEGSKCEPHNCPMSSHNAKVLRHNLPWVPDNLHIPSHNRLMRQVMEVMEQLGLVMRRALVLMAPFRRPATHQPRPATCRTIPS
jgi:hypothetical protein